jgi:hypothetical protein
LEARLAQTRTGLAEVIEPAKGEPATEMSDVAASTEGGNVWPDEAAESAFLAEARTHGEPSMVIPTGTAEPEEENEADGRKLPPLDDLVKRIPPEVREVLDDLFRAKFTAVRRVPKKSLKT